MNSKEYNFCYYVKTLVIYGRVLAVNVEFLSLQRIAKNGNIDQLGQPSRYQQSLHYIKGGGVW